MTGVRNDRKLFSVLSVFSVVYVISGIEFPARDKYIDSLRGINQDRIFFLLIFMS